MEFKDFIGFASGERRDIIGPSVSYVKTNILKGQKYNRENGELFVTVDRLCSRLENRVPGLLFIN